MGSAIVVVVEEGREPSGALRAVLPEAPIGPLAQACLDEALGFAIGLRGIGPRVGVLDAERLASLVEESGAVGRAVVGQEALDRYAFGGEASDGRLEERRGRVLALIGVHLHEAGSGVVVDGDVGELPAGAIDRIAPVAADPVPGSHDAPEL